MSGLLATSVTDLLACDRTAIPMITQRSFDKNNLRSAWKCGRIHIEQRIRATPMLETSTPLYRQSEVVTMSDIGNSNATFSDTLLKRCTKCGATKPCSGFSKDKSKRDGLNSRCKSCLAKYRNENPIKAREIHARYYRKNAAKVREAVSRYHLENINKERERIARYYRENADRLREKSVRYRRENPDKLREQNARYKRNNPDKARANNHRRRATKQALPSQWIDADAHRMLAYWGNRCAVCGQQVEPNNAFYVLAHDHWIPLTSPNCPGTVPWNMLPLCHSKITGTSGCNSLKQNADPIEWLNSLYSDDPKRVSKVLARIEQYFKWVKSEVYP